MFGGTNSNLNDILKVDKSQIAGIKIFLGSSTGNMLVDNHKAIEKIFKNTELPISVHCEDEEIIKKNLANDTEYSFIVQQIDHEVKLIILSINDESIISNDSDNDDSNQEED